ncbi:MAG: DUF493 domain-containing protein [Pseudomonadota bacterium]
MSDDSVIDFPQAFPIKIVGESGNGFDEHVLGLLQPFVEDSARLEFTRTDSRTGRYVSLTVTVMARSREQLDGIYQALTDSPRVLFSL